ncbi:hypothetical protein MAHJHV28_45720 [Mycobacterium avium subsp. hominissuis]
MSDAEIRGKIDGTAEPSAVPSGGWFGKGLDRGQCRRGAGTAPGLDLFQTIHQTAPQRVLRCRLVDGLEKV